MNAIKMIVAAFAFAVATSPVLARSPQEPVPDFGAVLPSANLQEGQRVAAQCLQCHDMRSTKLNQFGPPLWNVVGRPRATAPGFSYSPQMNASHQPWSYDLLFRYLRSPQLMVPGTPMTFSGLRSAKTRINLIAYLRTLADNPALAAPPKH